jgi:hypothetical protein
MDYWSLLFYILIIYFLFMLISNGFLFIKNLRINTILKLKIIDNIQPIKLKKTYKN